MPALQLWIISYMNIIAGFLFGIAGALVVMGEISPWLIPGAWLANCACTTAKQCGLTALADAHMRRHLSLQPGACAVAALLGPPLPLLRRLAVLHGQPAGEWLHLSMPYSTNVKALSCTTVTDTWSAYRKQLKSLCWLRGCRTTSGTPSGMTRAWRPATSSLALASAGVPSCMSRALPCCLLAR